MLYPLVRWTYTLLYAPLALPILAHLLQRRDSRRRLAEYRGPAPGRATIAAPRAKPVAWLHAVSVGEVLSALPILEALDVTTHLTTTIEDALVVADRSGYPFASTRFLPLDVPWFMSRLIETLKPDIALVCETDFWPNMLHELAIRRVPTFLINGRISHKICALYSLLGRFSSRMFSAFDRLIVQTELDAQRLEQIGLPHERILVLGNTKYDWASRPLAQTPHDRGASRLVSGSRPRIVVGSSHPGDEERVLDAMAGLDVELVIAPRHVNRASEIVRMAELRGLQTTLFSRFENTEEPGIENGARIDVVVVDVLGILPRLYEGARAAFIGGCFDGSGGHNFLEAVRHGVPVVMGPHVRNFHQDVRTFLEARAILQVQDGNGLGETLRMLVADSDQGREYGERGLRQLLLNRGAAKRTAEEIRKVTAGQTR